VAETIFEASQWIDAPPAVVFDYFIDPEKIVEWMGLEARVDPVEDGAWFILFPGGVETWGRFVVFEPPARLVFTWGSRLQAGVAAPGNPGLTVRGDSVVEVTLTERAGRTLLNLKHSGFADGEPVAAGWGVFLPALAGVVAAKFKS
jgi:uncharacterized protein YndB with AHSA1/START domain